ncbi:MAG: hypothetical protein QNJ63_23320 [Calothrix sp. MO_192.B10]|nr:hypothetical protein [Calothrix sp. MO_192.B10]
MIDRLEHTESELQKLKLEILQRDIAIASERLKNGEYTEYDDESLPSLLENIKAWGQGKQQFIDGETVSAAPPLAQLSRREQEAN